MGPGDRCGECAFAYDLDGAESAGDEILAGCVELAGVLSAVGVDARTRRRPDVWSPLEYACHVRDVLLVQRERVLRARQRDRPSFDPMGRDERVAYDGYADQDPVAVARQLGDAALLFANVLRRIPSPELERTVMYNYPARFERSLRWVAVHTAHEVQHHRLDVRRQMRGDKPRRQLHS